MPTGAQIAAKVAYGLGKGGNAAGFPYQWYRPQGTGAVVVSGNLLGSVTAFVATKASLRPQSSDWGKADRFAAFDPTNFLAGDYLVGEQTMFLAELIPLASSIRLVLCNETFTWSKMSDPPPGPGFRPGVRIATPQVVGWPGWLQPSDRRSPGELHLPGAVEMPSAEILLPPSIPGQILRGDQITTSEALPITYTVQSAISSPNGWQITAIRAGA